METKTTSASNSEADLDAAPASTISVDAALASTISVEAALASTISVEAFTQLQSQFDGLVAEIASLRESLAITQGHVQRIGECPGLKIF